MKINPIQVSFKANIETPAQSNELVPVSNPIQQSTDKLQEMAVTPDFQVKTPLKYTEMGKVQLPNSIEATMYKLENGQKVVVVPKAGPTVLKTYVNVGSMNEPDKVRGISHFIEHNLFNGSEGLEAGEFFATVNRLGASTNASTGFSATDYYIQSNLLKKTDLETQVKIHASMLETPKFAKEMIEKEKGPVTSEINMILDDPENIATNSTLKLLYNIETTSKDIIGGTVDNINKLTRDDVIDYYKRNYFPANMTTVITGEVQPEKAIELVSKYFQSKAPSPVSRNYEKLTPIQKSARRDLISDKTQSSIVCMGFNGPRNDNTKDKILLDAFQFFLVGSSVSRLNKTLEKIQTNAFVSSDRISSRPQDNTVILFSTQTSEENAENAIKLVFREIADLEKNPPTEQELNIVKKKLKLNLAQVFENSGIINSVIGTAMLDNDLQSVTQFEKVIDNLSSKDIVDFAKKYFDLNKVAITVVHPETADLKSINKNYEKAHNISFTGNEQELNSKKAIDLEQAKRYNITNNINLITNNVEKNLATVDMSIAAPIPADIKPGVDSILSVMLNRGSKFKDEKKFFTDLENQGIQTSFDATSRGIYINSMFLPADGVNAIKTLKEVLLFPRLTQKDFDYAKNLLKENLQNVSVSSRDGLFKELFKGQSYGVTMSELRDSIDNVTLADVQGLYAYIMQNAQANVAVTAPLESNKNFKNALFYELSTDFPSFKPAEPNLFNSYIPVSEKKVVVQEHSKSQAEIQMGYKFKINDNMKDSVTFELLNTILGGTPSSRLFADLRESQKLAYQVNSRIGYFDNSQVLSMLIKTTTEDLQTGVASYENLQKSLNGFNSHVKKLMNEKVSEEELENAKLTFKNKILSYNEMTADKNLSILGGMKSFYGVSFDNQLLDIVDKITVDDIQAAANYVFKTTPVVSVVATKNTIEKNKDYLASLGEIVQ